MRFTRALISTLLSALAVFAHRSSDHPFAGVRVRNSSDSFTEVRATMNLPTPVCANNPDGRLIYVGVMLGDTIRKGCGVRAIIRIQCLGGNVFYTAIAQWRSPASTPQRQDVEHPFPMEGGNSVEVSVNAGQERVYVSFWNFATSTSADRVPVGTRAHLHGCRASVAWGSFAELTTSGESDNPLIPPPFAMESCSASVVVPNFSGFLRPGDLLDRGKTEERMRYQGAVVLTPQLLPIPEGGPGEAGPDEDNPDGNDPQDVLEVIQFTPE